MTKQRDDARRILHDVFGYPDFRGRQADIVDTLAGGGSLTVLMPTGGGKSLCYQIPALMRGTLRKPAASPISAAPGTVSLGSDCRPPSIKVRAP